MKRLILILGSFLLASTVTLAVEKPVKEKETIIYKDKVEFKPNGYIDLRYRYYGDTENNGEGLTVNPDGTTRAWNYKNNYSRIQLQGKVNMTEKQALEYRIRKFNSLDSYPEIAGSRNNGHDMRFYFWNNHGKIGNTKIDLTSRIEYKDYLVEGSDYQYAEYQLRFDFAEYLPKNDYINFLYFALAPKYRYLWNSNNDNYSNQIGMNIDTFFLLPKGFSSSVTLYFTEYFYGREQYFNGLEQKDDKNFDIWIEAYLYNSVELYRKNNFSLKFGFEGGMEAYGIYSHYRKYGTAVHDGKYADEYKELKKPKGKLWGTGKDRVNYQLYALPYLKAEYEITPSFIVSLSAGAEYRNFVVTNKSSASNWRWQPSVWAGFKTVF